MKKRGPKSERCRWTIERAAVEFGINPRTLVARLKQGGIDPDAEGYWTTMQIVRGIYDDLESERIRLTRAQADGEELRNAKDRGELVPVDEFARRWEPVFIDMVRIIKSSKLTEDEQFQIQSELERVMK